MNTAVRNLLWTAAALVVAPVGCNARLFIDKNTDGESPGNDAGAGASAGFQGAGGSAGALDAGGNGGGSVHGTGGAMSPPRPDSDSGTCSARPKTCGEVRPAVMRVPLGPEPGSGLVEAIWACLHDRCAMFSPEDLPGGGATSTSHIYVNDTVITVQATLTNTPDGREFAAAFDPTPFDPNLRNGDEYSVVIGAGPDGGPTTTSIVAKSRATYRNFVDENGLSCVEVTLQEVAPDADPDPDPGPCSRTTPATIGVQLGLQNLPPDATELVQFCYRDYCTSFAPSERFAEKPVQTWTHDHFSEELRTTTLRLTTDPSGAQVVTATFHWEPDDAFLRNTDTYEARVGSTTGTDASVEFGPWITRSRQRATYRSVVENSGPCGDPISCLDVTLTPLDD